MTGSEEPARVGVVAGSARMLREVLRTPRVRRVVQVLMRDLDPENAPAVVDALAEDPAFLLDLIGLLPALANLGLNGTDELLRRLLSYPSGLFEAFFRQLVEQVDAEKLGAVAAFAVALAGQTHRGRGAEKGEVWVELGQGVARGWSKAFARMGRSPVEAAAELTEGVLRTASGLAAWLGTQAAIESTSTARVVRLLATGIRRIAEENPDFVAHVARPLAEAGRAALARAEDC